MRCLVEQPLSSKAFDLPEMISATLAQQMFLGCEAMGGVVGYS